MGNAPLFLSGEVESMKHLSKGLDEQVTITSYETDFNGLMKVPAMLNRFQEVALKHCDGTTIGREFLLEHDMFWALARIRIEIKHRPRLNQDIKVSTWPSTYDKMFAYREYGLYAEGTPLVLGTADWILMNINTRKPCRTKMAFDAGGQLPEDQESAIGTRPGKIIVTGQMTKRITRTVSYNDIDMYGHVNNAKYVEWAFDTLSVEELRERDIVAVEASFIAECKDGEYVETNRYDEGPNIIIIEILDTDKGTKSCQVKLELEQRS